MTYVHTFRHIDLWGIVDSAINGKYIAKTIAILAVVLQRNECCGKGLLLCLGHAWLEFEQDYMHNLWGPTAHNVRSNLPASIRVSLWSITYETKLFVRENPQPAKK
jgi:hypothetical protein